MTYKIYCYRSEHLSPDIAEAKRVISFENNQLNLSTSEHRRAAQLISVLRKATAKLDHFEGFNEGFSIINPTPDSILSNHITLSSTRQETGFQVEIFPRYVLISIVTGSAEITAEATFKEVDNCIKCIGQSAKYFVYDPQKEKAYDPLKEDVPIK
ncbi:MAG: hypothetical protein ABIX01_15875 [Chitinophagaceae bacterium]